MQFKELMTTISLLEMREREAASMELKRELRQTIAHFRMLRDDRIRMLVQQPTVI